MSMMPAPVLTETPRHLAELKARTKELAARHPIGLSAGGLDLFMQRAANLLCQQHTCARSTYRSLLPPTRKTMSKWKIQMPYRIAYSALELF